MGGGGARKNKARVLGFFMIYPISLLFLISHGSGTLFHFSVYPIRFSCTPYFLRVGSNLYLCSLCHPPTHGQDSSTASDAAPRFFFPPPPPPPPTFPLPAREDDARGACEVKIRNGPTLVATRVRLGKRHRASYRACHRRLASHRWRCHRSCHRMPRQREVEPSTWCRLRWWCRWWRRWRRWQCRPRLRRSPAPCLPRPSRLPHPACSCLRLHLRRSVPYLLPGKQAARGGRQVCTSHGGVCARLLYIAANTFLTAAATLPIDGRSLRRWGGAVI